jgi:sulfite exporter TauE/SafE
MDSNLVILCVAALSIAVLHTLCGPDHYIPFVAMSRAGHWSRRKTVVVTLLCGLGHVGSSVVLGFVGISLGLMLSRVEFVEQVRGNVAGWLMIGFGLAYLVWSGMHGWRRRSHSHRHAHSDQHAHASGTGQGHAHSHWHLGGLFGWRRAHPALALTGQQTQTHARGNLASRAEAGGGPAATVQPTSSNAVTPWLLFTIFVFGPCEPLIPLLMYPAAQSSWLGVAAVSIVFLLGTLAVMLATVLVLVQGTRALKSHWLERHAHSMAGLVILLCGLTITMGL